MDRRTRGINTGFSDRSRDSPLPVNVNIVSDGKMITHANHPSQCAIPADRSATGYSRAGSYPGTLTYPDVVSNMNLIIEDHMILQHRVAQGTAVDCCTRPYFHMISDDHST